MDHSMHQGMDHSMHDMPGMDSEMCSMAMLFTWNYKNTCVVSSKWHIKTKFQMFLSCIIIFMSTYLAEYFKVKFNQYKLKNSAVTNTEENKTKQRQYESIFYGLQWFYSFMLMLVFMTYNGWLMLAMTLGATAGYYKFSYNNLPVNSPVGCH